MELQGKIAATKQKEARAWRLRSTMGAAVIILIVGIAAYSNSFSGPFIFDGIGSIVRNPHIRRLWPITEAMKAPAQSTADGRPVLCLSLGINYQISELEVWSYHAVNLIIHLAAGLLVFGIVRRSLLTERLRRRFGHASTVLGTICAAIWVVHPLQTQAVTYIIQRAESLMGLFYLSTLYFAIRGFTSPRRKNWWYAGSVAACAAGMGTKEVMVSAPVMVLLYDRIFVSRSFGQLLKRRWALYLALAVTWAILAGLTWAAPRSESAGFELKSLTPLEYARTQCLVIVRYIRLAFWPRGLVLDYARDTVKSFGEYGLQALCILAMLIATVAALRYRPGWGFLGAWFFLILAPTSSFVPIADPIFEHRMYLPLAAIVLGVVLGTYVLGSGLAGSTRSLKKIVPVIGYLLAAGIVIALGVRTVARNGDYRSRMSIWLKTVEVCPQSCRAHYNLGMALKSERKHHQAILHYNEAIRIHPGYYKAYAQRGRARSAIGQFDEALKDFDMALETCPTDAMGVKLIPDYIAAYNNRAIAYTQQGLFDRAIDDYSKCIELDPNGPLAYWNRATARYRNGDRDGAIRDLTKVIHLSPKDDKAYLHRATAYQEKGEYDRSIADLDRVIELRPDYIEAYMEKGRILAGQGKHAQLIEHWRGALKNRGDSPTVLNALAWLLATHEDAEYRNGREAVTLAERACELTGRSDPAVLDTLAAAYAETRRFDEAVTTIQKALKLLSPTDNQELRVQFQSRLELYKSKRPYREHPGTSAGGN